jgi:predicted RNase H-like nuclease
MLVAGIDVWRKRWIAVVLSDRRYERAVVDSSLGKLLEALSGMAAIGIDMPFGLTSGGRRREADALARKFVGPLGSAVFPTYPREVYAAADYDAARETCLRLTQGSISRQAWALRERILELERTVEGQREVREVHPEVSFREMAGRHLSWRKSSWNGLHERKRLLIAQGVEMPTELATTGNAGAEDVLDAAAAAWSADRIARGAARSFPDPPQAADGRHIAIWY